jgi:hypothetical protein
MTMVMLQHERKLSAEFDPSYRAEVEALFDALLAETGALVAQHWAAIDRVATALLNNEVSGTCRRLTQDDIDALIATARQPWRRRDHAGRSSSRRSSNCRLPTTSASSCLLWIAASATRPAFSKFESYQAASASL